MTQKNYNTSGTNYQQNKYLYNGKEIQDDVLGGVSLDWYDYGARFYDPSLGRFHTHDPLAESYYLYSPYGYCAGNPISSRDENGEWINNVVGAFVGGITEYASQAIGNVASQMINGTSLSEVNFEKALVDDIDFGDVALSAGEGFLTSGASAVKKVLVKTTVTVAKNAVDWKGDGSITVHSADKVITDSVLDGVGELVPTPKVKYKDNIGEAANKLKKNLKSSGVPKNKLPSQKQISTAIRNGRETTQYIVDKTAEIATGATGNVVKEKITPENYEPEVKK